jgi:hypothetical protein
MYCQPNFVYQHIFWGATSEIIKNAKQNNCPLGEKFTQSSHPVTRQNMSEDFITHKTVGTTYVLMKVENGASFWNRPFRQNGQNSAAE